MAGRVPQVECPSVTPEVVLKASGHVERFTDFMVTDVLTHDCHRADHLLEAALEARLADAKAPPTAEEREVRRPYTLTIWLSDGNGPSQKQSTIMIVKTASMVCMACMVT